MSDTRLERLQRLLEKKPGDPFTLYGLALEYRNLGRDEEAMTCFSRLLDEHPDYLPAYYQYGVLLGQVEKVEEARETLQAGLELAEKVNDPKARLELAAALDELRA